MNQQSPLTGRISRRILRRSRPLPFILITLLCFFAAALLLAACGGSSRDSFSNGGDNAP
ncbi:MAG: hypothetical protein IPL78_28815 [Chloroflexi bacterium]|nr:hypothetical protein [Chloroflexota bacterium]